MTEKPSWYSSTLSQLAIASVGGYLVAALYFAWKIKDMSHLRWAAEIFGVSYLTARGMNQKAEPKGGSDGS